MQHVEWIDRHLTTTPPDDVVNIPIADIAAILGMDRYRTGFQIWCEVLGVWERPVTEWDQAKQIIKQKQIEYMKGKHERLMTPAEYYGADYAERRLWHYTRCPLCFTGVWDSILVDDKYHPATVIVHLTADTESEWLQWKDGKLPRYQVLHGAIYAHILDVCNIMAVCSHVGQKGPAEAAECVLTDENTICIPINIFDDDWKPVREYIDDAMSWYWHVHDGESPDYNAYKDKDVLMAIRKAEREEIMRTAPPPPVEDWYEEIKFD